MRGRNSSADQGARPKGATYSPLSALNAICRLGWQRSEKSWGYGGEPPSRSDSFLKVGWYRCRKARFLSRRRSCSQEPIAAQLRFANLQPAVEEFDIARA